MKIAVVSVFALFCAVGAFGEMPSYCNDYLKTSGSNYENSPLVLGDDWFSGNAPSAGSTNYIGVGMTVKGPTPALLKTYPFKGDCFVLAGTMYMHAGSVSWKDLRLLDGAIYAWGSNSSLSGNLLVESGAQSPASIRTFFGNGMTFTDVNASVKGGADAALVLRRTTSGPAKVEMPDHYFFVKGSWDDYLGTVTVATNSALAFNSTAAAGNKTLGGKVVVERGGYWFGIMGFGYPSGVYTEVGSLEMQDGSFFWARPDSEGRATLVVVTNELTLGKVKFEFKKDWSAKAKTDAPLPAYQYADGERCKESKFQLFNLTGAAAEKVPDLSGCMLPDHPNGFCGALPVDKRLVCEDNADGSKTIFMRYRTDFDWTMNTAKTTQKGWSECALNPANASYWVDGEMPSPDSVGVACATKAMEWRGPTNSDGFDFPGLTFVLDGALYLYAAYANVGNLVLMGGKNIWTHQGANEKHLRGKITVLSGAGASGIYNYIGTSLYIDARIAGDGELHLRQDANLKPQATYHLTADNSDFHGRLTSMSKFANGDRGAYPDPSKGWYATIYLGGDHCLGGAYTGSKAFSALTLGSWTKLKIEPTLDAVTLAEAGRGILITNECLQVETLAGQTLAVKQQLTYNGNLLKLGEGCIELASGACFGDGLSEPEADRNRLVVSNGTVRVSATNAVDGVQIEVAEGARLAVDASCAAEGMAEYGFVNTRWATPFVSGLDDGTIPVEVKGLEEGKAATVAICTVSAETAANLRLRVVRAPHFVCTQAKRVNDDGTVTFTASFRPVGFGIIVR